MRRAGLAGVSRRKRIRTTIRGERARPAPDLVERDFSLEAANRPWVADITDAPTRAGFLHLAAVLDAFGRRIVGWAMAAHPRDALTDPAAGPRDKDNPVGDIKFGGRHGVASSGLVSILGGKIDNILSGKRKNSNELLEYQAICHEFKHTVLHPG